MFLAPAHTNSEVTGDHCSIKIRQEAQIRIFSHIEDFYNGKRLNSATGYRASEEFEQQELKIAV